MSCCAHDSVTAMHFTKQCFYVFPPLQKTEVYKRVLQAIIYPTSGELLPASIHVCVCVSFSHTLLLATELSHSPCLSVCLSVCLSLSLVSLFVLCSSIFPDQDRHDFREKSYRKPTYCNECEGFIWGLAKQGVQCRRK